MAAMLAVLILGVLLSLPPSEADDTDVQVKTRFGVIRGTWKSTLPNHRIFSSFEGIPYAKPPVKDLRFQPPQTNHGFDSFHAPGHPFLATQPSAECVQLDYLTGEAKGEEDCLTLNIYTPVTDFTEFRPASLPVMVWIHGGGFQIGSGSSEFYGPERLLEHGVVVVTLNYRLGPLGFLTTEDDNAPPNLGLLDQRMAMRWVKQHIDSFGGNQLKVTLFGVSAGGMSVMYHVASPGSEGLFQAAISMSGVFGDHSLLTLSKKPSVYTKVLAKEVGCQDVKESAAIAECLRGVDAKELTKKATMFRTFKWLPEPFKPVMDKLMTLNTMMDKFMEYPVVMGRPADVWKKPPVKTVPLMVGGNKDEGILFIHEFMLGFSSYSDVQENFAKYGPTLLFGVDPDVAELDETETASAEYLRQMYLGGENMVHLPEEDEEIKHPFNESQRAEIINLFTDVHFLAPIDAVVKALAKAENPVFYYNYQHQGSFSFPMLHGLPAVGGVSHLDEMFLLWNMPFLGNRTIQTDQDELVSQKLLEMWTNFAKTGNPSADGSWPSIQEAGQIKYAVVDSQPLRMEYPQQFKRRMESVQQMTKLANLLRHVDPEEHPIYKALVEEKEAWEKEEIKKQKKKDKDAKNKIHSHEDSDKMENNLFKDEL